MKDLFKFKNINQEKEVLQVFVLDVLSQTKFLKRLTLQGGTALRLCYGSDRFSEDLDFTGFLDEEEIKEIAGILEHELGNKILNETKTYIREGHLVSQIAVRVYPKDSSQKRLEVKLEIARVPSLSTDFKRIYSKYYPDISVFALVESLEEIFADKIVAFGLRKFLKILPFKARDVWDISWLLDRRISLDSEIVINKLKDYNADFDTFISTFEKRLNVLNTKKGMETFKAEMMRFAEDQSLILIKEDAFVNSTLIRVASFLSGLNLTSL